MIRAVEALLEDAARGDDTAALKLELLVERERVHKPNDHDIADTLGPQLLAVRLSTDDIGEIVQRIGGELSTAARPLASLAWILVKSYDARASISDCDLGSDDGR
jgi:hypothetical protein